MIEVLAKDAMADACFPGNPRDASLEDVIELFKKICALQPSLFAPGLGCPVSAGKEPILRRSSSAPVVNHVARATARDAPPGFAPCERSARKICAQI